MLETFVLILNSLHVLQFHLIIWIPTFDLFKVVNFQNFRLSIRKILPGIFLHFDFGSFFCLLLLFFWSQLPQIIIYLWWQVTKYIFKKKEEYILKTKQSRIIFWWNANSHPFYKKLFQLLNLFFVYFMFLPHFS